MGELANAAQGRRLQRKDTKRDIKETLRKNWDRIEAVIPEYMTSERLYQISVSAINTTPKLNLCDSASILSCVMKCASLGLEPSAVDGLGRAYIVPRWNKRTHGYRATVVLGYSGMIELAYRSGEVDSIISHAVYEGDEFQYWEDDAGQHLTWSPTATERTADKITGVYAAAHLKDGAFIVKYLPRSEIERARGFSDAADKGPWASDYAAMAEKTAIRRLFKYLPISVQGQTGKAIAEIDGSTPDMGKTLKQPQQQQQLEAASKPEPCDEPEYETEGVEIGDAYEPEQRDD